ncbi:OsmC family protein [Flagellimonas meridianipacifica]|uniref:Organic hydroperoxide reductase OsmC/OhrA n=1 Tax=Flagellimonas meridianipacifica TaxID=1080225 RepID=A0A2T0MAR6_9FLAO|nr:OsmC family protein [Allomuricauda pacifica]PRX54597.1 organic hydroperoxide reductase OsmC/OhrA [Allomuricauda pacifica]
MKREHNYFTTIRWTGNQGKGTSNYKAFERSYIVSVDNKPDIHGSSDPAFRGDRTKYNPEELLLASLSSCHMLWYLHLCSEAGINVIDYTDNAHATMVETPDGGGRFSKVVLNPRVTISDSSIIERAKKLHLKANEFCFIANSVNFKVDHNPTFNSQ